MQWLAALCVRRPVLATVLSLVILVVGSVFYAQLGVDQFPKIDFPVVVVSTIMPGASPEDVERDVTDKVEAAVNVVGGIDELRSISSEGISQVIVQFVLEKNGDVAAQEVQQKINLALGDLPKGIDPPIIMKFDPDANPVLYISLNGPGKSQKDLTVLADRVVRRRLESVNGVGQVTVLGGRKRQVNVLVDPVKLRSLGMSPAEVAMAINARLPQDVRVRDAAIAPDAFDPISDCTSKCYRYSIAHGDRGTDGMLLFERRTTWCTWHVLDVARMREAAGALVGTHDFAAFAQVNHGRDSTVRTVFGCTVTEPSEGRARIEVCGNGFLYNMVRIIAGTLSEVGRGRIGTAEVRRALAEGDRTVTGPTLPPHGLRLEWARYGAGA